MFHDIKNRLKQEELDVKLKIFWVQCIGLFFLGFISSFVWGFIKLDPVRLILDLCLGVITVVFFLMSFQTKKIKPYSYILLLICNLSIVLLFLLLDDISKITIFSYFSLSIIFTVMMFDKIKRMIFVLLETILYGVIVAFLLSENMNLAIYNILIQTIISTCTMVTCIFIILKVYEHKADNLEEINLQLKDSALRD